MLCLCCCTRLSLVPASGGSSGCGAQASRCGGFSCEVQALGFVGFSRCSSWALEHRLSGCEVQALGFVGFSRCGSWALERRLSGCEVQALGFVGFSRCSSWALEHRLSGCEVQALLHHSMWSLPGSGIELTSPTLQGGFSVTGPPGKPL